MAGWLIITVVLSISASQWFTVLIYVPRHENVLGSGSKAPRILNLGIRWGEWSALPPSLPAPDTHWTGGWAGSRAGLDTLAKRKISLSSPEIEPRSSSLQLTEPSRLLFICLWPQNESLFPVTRKVRPMQGRVWALFTSLLHLTKQLAMNGTESPQSNPSEL